MPPPKPKGQFIRPAFAFDPEGSFVTDGYNRGYISPDTADASSAFQSPAIDYPFLYHGGTARAVFMYYSPYTADLAPPTFSVSDDSAWDNGQSFYRPSGPKPWGKAGYMVRVPRCVVLMTWTVQGEGGAKSAAVIPALAAALDAAGAALVVAPMSPAMGGSPPGYDWNNFVVTLGFPPSLVRTSLNPQGGAPYIATSPGIGSIDPATWMGGQVLVIACLPTPYIGHCMVTPLGVSSPTTVPTTGGFYATGVGGQVFVIITMSAGDTANFSVGQTGVTNPVITSAHGGVGGATITVQGVTTTGGSGTVSGSCQNPDGTPWIPGGSIPPTSIGVSTATIPGADETLAYTAAGYTLTKVAPDFDPFFFYLVQDSVGLPFALESASAMAARCGRFRGVMLYEPSPSVGPTAGVTWDQVQAVYPDAQCFGDETSGLAWSRVPVSGTGIDQTPAAAFANYTPAIISAIQAFWPPPPP